MSATTKVSKVVLAYSGGLDTSAILYWLKERYGCEVVSFTADLGQPEELASARAKAEALGVREIYIEDLRDRFVRDFVFPMFRANALYEGEYLLGTAIARPLIAARLVEIAHATGADAVAHGATAKGNDQLRFELGVASLAPQLQVIAPWRIWDFGSRQELVTYCKKNNVAVDFDSGSESPRSMDANLLHISYEGGALEDPSVPPPESMWRWTLDPLKASDVPLEIEIGFECGDATHLNGKALPPAKLLTALNELGAAHGVGRSDIVENRAIGMKSRGCYEAPGGTILARAHRAIESITLEREAAHLKDALMLRYADLIYNGYWWSPERYMLQAAIDSSQQHVSGVVRVRIYKGCVTVIGRRSENSLYDKDAVSFEHAGGHERHVDEAGAYIRTHTARFKMRPPATDTAKHTLTDTQLGDKS